MYDSTRRGSRRQLLSVCCAVLLLVIVAGCVSHVQRQTPQLRREAGAQPASVVMPLDVELSEMTAGGLAQPQAEWTDAAHSHMRAVLEEHARARNLRLVFFDPARGSDEDRDDGLALVALHRAVGSSVLIHQYMGRPLPSKEGRFDWSLGPSAEAIARAQGADYALFLFVRDSYASAGRIAVIAVAALLGAGVPGGSQVGFASLVDLRNGDIVWFNWLQRASGDLRTQQGASETVELLVSDAMK
jgi:hypothetical protein